MTEPFDDFERRLAADLRSYLEAGAPRVDAGRAAQGAMGARPARSTSFGAVLAGAAAILVVAAVGLAVMLSRVPLPPVGASASPSGPTPMPASPAPTTSPAASPLIVDGWVIPTPYPLPEGAVSLPLDTLPAPERLNLPSGATFGVCHQARIGVEISYDPSATPALTFNGGAGPLWPHGVSARLYNGRVEIVGPDGTVLGRDGEHVVFSGGTYGDTERSLVCIPSTFPVPAVTNR